MNEAQVPVDSGFGKILNAGRNLWLAGLGVAAGVEESGRDLFGRLVELGRPVEEKQKKVATDVAEKTTATVKSLGKLVEDTVAYESREMLKRFNVMTKDDVRIFAARLDTLGKKLDHHLLSLSRPARCPLWKRPESLARSRPFLCSLA